MRRGIECVIDVRTEWGGEGGRKGVLSLHMARYEHSFRLFLIDTIDCV